MKKTKLFTSLAALALVLSLGACTEPTEEETTSEDTSVVETTTETETTTEDTSEDETTSESTSEGNTSENTSEGGSTSESTGDEPTTIDFSGKFDFTTNGVGEDLASTAMSSATDLDGFWTGDDLYVCCREYGSIWLGNKENGAFQSNGLIKVGASGGQGVLNFKFAVGVNIEKVVVSAHSWTTSEANNLTINGETLAMPQSGSFEELTYEFEDEYQNILSFNCKSRGFVQYIEVYGTYTDSVEPITELVLSAEETKLNAGSSVEVTVSTVPTTAFDIDALVWTSDNENAVTVSQNLTGATVHAAGAGTAKVTATAENGVKGEITFEVEDVLEESETFVPSQLGYSNEEVVEQIDGHQVAITFALGTQTTSSNIPKYYDSGTAIRVYTGNTVTFSAKYENAPISSIVLSCNSSYVGGTLTCTNCTSSVSGTTVTLTPTGNGNPVVSPSSQWRINQFTIYYNLAA